MVRTYIVYTSGALAGDVTVAGELSAEIYAATTGTDTDWVAVLTDVDPLGNSTRLSHYIVRARYRHGFDAALPVTPGSVERYRIFLPNLAHVFRAGHRIRFTLTSSSKNVRSPIPTRVPTPSRTRRSSPSARPCTTRTPVPAACCSRCRLAADGRGRPKADEAEGHPLPNQGLRSAAS